MANSEDPNEMPHYAVFHKGLHCLLIFDKIDLPRKIYNISFEIITCVPSKYTMDHPDVILCSSMGNPIVLKGLTSGTVFTCNMTEFLIIIISKRKMAEL